MALASMDALGAFSHLQNNLPSWITRVSELAAHASAKHAEYTAAYRRHATYKPRRRRNSSVCSIHTNDVVPIAQREGPTSEALEANTTTTLENDASMPAQTAGRKRGTDEAPSIDSSERYAFVSTRHNVIIEYDGHTQKALEEIVRDLGIARNNIRRGKMGMMPRGGLRASLLHKTSAGGGQPGENGSPLSALSYVRSTRAGGGLVGVTGSSGIRKESPFDFADKQLELAHGLCETAAYQVLRSGDCATELDGVEEKFKMLLEMANNEVKRLEEEKKQQEEEEAKAQSESQSESVEEDAPAKPPLTPTAARLARLAAITAGASKPTSTAHATIEVDDASSISAESIDLSAFRASRIRV
ncbi:uncharacterized protein N7473_004999 [Penicillium subrubescens]|uniref:Uncharacterized protein n=1 Tax=Penicillium subrubescens TaxID=1316194 RepID=A0A1Q5UHZ7_9EURO|nr:uncharacterized protein N7473_004999 [Penicillium subrubescens]KAJ5900929.1 hypothetical protein N7473_004999 [Penicillium subrubescens]OKP12059.1 hypothetical protein PENSUB_2417 [Penicillium subrubescens]